MLFPYQRRTENAESSKSKKGFDNNQRAVEQGKFVGPKPPLKIKEIWAIRVQLELADRIRDLALLILQSTVSCVAVILFEFESTTFIPARMSFRGPQ